MKSEARPWNESMTTRPTRHWSKFRMILIAAALVWGSYIMALFRTAQFGISLDELFSQAFVAFLFAGLPFSAVLFDRNARQILAGMVLATTFSWTTAELFARAQEIHVIAQYGRTPSHFVSVKRWWPFESSGIVYSPESGWSGHD